MKAKEKNEVHPQQGNTLNKSSREGKFGFPEDPSEWDELTNRAAAPANSGSETGEQIKTARLGIIKSRTFPHSYKLNI